MKLAIQLEEYLPWNKIKHFDYVIDNLKYEKLRFLSFFLNYRETKGYILLK